MNKTYNSHLLKINAGKGFPFKLCIRNAGEYFKIKNLQPQVTFRNRGLRLKTGMTWVKLYIKLHQTPCS